MVVGSTIVKSDACICAIENPVWRDHLGVVIFTWFIYESLWLDDQLEVLNIIARFEDGCL